MLDGSAGHDVIYGGNGADVLIGGNGDILAGGKGATNLFSGLTLGLTPSSISM